MGLCFPRSMCADFLPVLGQCESREMCKRIALIETLGNIFVQFFFNVVRIREGRNKKDVFQYQAKDTETDYETLHRSRSTM